jgi:hypothetical protein
VPKRHIVQGLRQDVLEWLIARQSKAVEKYGVKDPRIAAFIILDDVIADQKTIRWSADLQRFFVQGRHLAITVFIASQYLKGVGPMVRGNCDYIFLQPVSLFKKCMREYCLLARDDKFFTPIIFVRIAPHQMLTTLPFCRFSTRRSAMLFGIWR